MTSYHVLQLVPMMRYPLMLDVLVIHLILSKLAADIISALILDSSQLGSLKELLERPA